MCVLRGRDDSVADDLQLRVAEAREPLVTRKRGMYGNDAVGAVDSKPFDGLHES